ncbi:hypothetical protein GCM10017600_84390 [Streptosporangium carneum]|uniref:Uncharacterized protein n=1 Tax=Streptosporangium carneum TaxID=47481 RepID=A0A9W6MI65_9ACTN|nr:hypothetical protein GCM10017600_84390 [Streptosporangium carneum]
MAPLQAADGVAVAAAGNAAATARLTASAEAVTARGQCDRTARSDEKTRWDIDPFLRVIGDADGPTLQPAAHKAHSARCQRAVGHPPGIALTRHGVATAAAEPAPLRFVGFGFRNGRAGG